MSRKLVLFDIDGTLIAKISPDENDKHSYAVNKVFGINASRKEIDFEGKTDKQIVIELAGKYGVDMKTILADLSHVFSEIIKYIECRLDLYHEIPHARELLVELQRRGDTRGLVTGNIEKIAKLKLQKVGLIDFFEVGGFGDSSERRSDLVLTAIRHAEEKFKTKIQKNDVFVIGDTPRDIECGKESGVRTIAMATGPCPLNELKKHKPDYAFSDFSDTDSIVHAIHND